MIVMGKEIEKESGNLDKHRQMDVPNNEIVKGLDIPRRNGYYSTVFGLDMADAEI